MTMVSGKAMAARLIGWTAVVVSLGFVGLQLWQHAPWQLAAAHLRPLVMAIVIGAVLYGLACFLASSAWHQLLAADDSCASSRWHHVVYGRTQIAKYLPGNVFHLVGRQVMGRRLGHGQASLGLASLLEAMLLVLVAGALSVPMLGQWLDLAAVGLLAAAAAGLALIAAHWIWRHHHPALCALVQSAGRARERAVRSITGRLARAVCLYTAFFLVVAAIFWMLALSVSDRGWPAIDLAATVPVVALAWLVGFVTPGSSAGIGVREAVLIAALEGTLGAQVSGVIALALRLVTIGGDLVFFGLSMALTPAGGWPGSMALGSDRA
jgi:hypothetical protein